MTHNDGMFYAPKGVSSKVIVSDQGYVCGMTRAFLDEIKQTARKWRFLRQKEQTYNFIRINTRQKARVFA